MSFQENECVKFVLVDFQDNFLYRQLKTKFNNQSKGFILFMSNKQDSTKHFLPIEFSKDKNYIINHIRKFKKSSSFICIRYLTPSICPDLLYNNIDLVQELSKLERSFEYGHLLKFIDYHEKKYNQQINNYSNFMPNINKEYVLSAVKKNGNDLLKFQQFNKDKEIVIEAIRQNGNGLYYADISLRNDREVVMESIKYNGHTFYYMSEELANDRFIALESVKHIPGSFRYAPISLKKDRSFVCQAASNNGLLLEYLSNDFTTDREIIINAVAQNGYSIKFSPDEFKKDESLILTCIKKALNLDQSIEIDREMILEYAKNHSAYLIIHLEKFRNEKEIYLKALHENGKRMNDRNRRDRNFILDMLNENWKIFDNADLNVKNQKEVYTNAFDINCNCFVDDYNSELFIEVYKYRKKILQTSEKIEMDKEIALKVIHQNLSVKKFLNFNELLDQVTSYLKLDYFNNDKEFMFSVIKLNTDYIEFASDELRDDADFMLQYAKNTFSISRASDRLRNDRKFLMKSTEITFSFCAPFELRSDREFMMESVKLGSFLNYASDDLKSDRELVMTAIKAHSENYYYCCKELQHDREIVIETLKKNGKLFNQIPEELKRDRNLILLALKSNHPPLNSINEICKTFAADREIMLECTKIDGEAMIGGDHLLPDEFLLDKEFVLEVAGSNESASLHAFKRFGKDLVFLSCLSEKYGLCSDFDENLFQKRLESYYFGAKLPFDS